MLVSGQPGIWQSLTQVSDLSPSGLPCLQVFPLNLQLSCCSEGCLLPLQAGKALVFCHHRWGSKEQPQARSHKTAALGRCSSLPLCRGKNPRSLPAFAHFPVPANRCSEYVHLDFMVTVWSLPMGGTALASSSPSQCPPSCIAHRSSPVSNMPPGTGVVWLLSASALSFTSSWSKHF